MRLRTIRQSIQVLFLSLVGGLSMHLFAASEPTQGIHKSLNLQTAVSAALDRNHGLKAARQRVEQAKSEISVTRTLLYPNLNLIGTTEMRKGATQGSSAPPFEGKPYSQNTAHLKLVQPLLVFGSLAAIEKSEFQVQIFEADLAMAERELVINVVSTYYKVILNQRLLTILERTETVVNDSLVTTEQRLRTGRGQLLDLLQVKTQIALLKPKIEDAHNQLESAYAQLFSYLNEEIQPEIQLQGTLKDIVSKDPPKVLQPARWPELEKVHLQRDQIRREREVIGGKHKPNLSLLGDYGFNSNTRRDLFTHDSNNWSVILQLTIPLFSGFESVHERRSLISQDRQFEEQALDLENQLKLAQVQSLKTLQSTSASLISAEEAAELSERSMVEARRNYRLSTIDFLQFLTVQQAALQAASALETVRYENILALARYFVATGQPLPELINRLEAK